MKGWMSRYWLTIQVILMLFSLVFAGGTASAANESGDDEGDRSIMDHLEDIKDEVWNAFLDFIPGLIVFFVILLVGYIVAKAVASGLARLLDKAGLEKAMKKVRMDVQVRKLGFEKVSVLLGTLMFWFIFAMVIQAALDFAGIKSLSAILTPVVLFIPRVIIAVVLILVGLYVAELAVDFIRTAMTRHPLGRDLVKLDKQSKRQGLSVMNIAFIFVKVFIVLIFLEVALEILAISVLSDFINPLLVAIPLILTAMAIILVGLLVSEWVIKLVVGLLKEFEFNKLIAPVEKTIRKKGIIMQVLTFVLKLFIMLFFVQFAIAVLNTTGQFDMFSQLINEIILWMPNLLVAIFIVLAGFWLAGWAHDQTLEHGKKMDVPFLPAVATAVKFLVIYIAVVMAMDQVGIQVDILYIMFTIAVAAVFIGLGVGLAFGSKDLFHNMVGSIQNNQTLSVGMKVKVDQYEGTVERMDRYHVVLKTASGKARLPHSKLVNAVIEEGP